MEENNKTFIVKDEHIKSIIGTFKKCYTKEKESLDFYGITLENMENILEAFSGKNAAFVEYFITAIASTLPIDSLEHLMKSLRLIFEAKIVRKLTEKMKNYKS